MKARGTSKRRTPTFSKAEWMRFLKWLKGVTGLGFSLLDRDGNKLVETAPFAPICRMIRRSSRGRLLCERCWRDCLSQIHDRTGSTVWPCAAGMSNVIVPIRVGRFSGYLVGGETRVEGARRNSEACNKLREIAPGLGISQDKLVKAYLASPAISAAQLEERRRSFGGLVHMLRNMIVDGWFVRAAEDIQSQARAGNVGRLWETLARYVRTLVDVKDVQILTTVPGRDTLAQVWLQASPENAVKLKDLEAGREQQPIVASDDKLFIPVRSGDEVCAVIMVTLPCAATPIQEDITRLAKLAGVAADALTVILERHRRERLKTLECRLAGRKSGADRLNVILAECVHLLNGASGDVALVRRSASDNGDFPAGWLRVVARYGRGAEKLPYLVPRTVGITGRVLRTKATAIVTDTSRDADYLEAAAEDGPLSRTYESKSWQAYKGFLRRIRACVKIPLMVGDEPLGVMAVHRHRKGSFDLAEISIAAALARRAAEEAACILVVEDAAHRMDVISGPGSARESLTKQFTDMSPADARQKLCEELAEKVLSVSGAFRAAVRIFSPERGTLGTKCALPPAMWPKDIEEELPLDRDCAATHAFTEAASYLIEDTARVKLHYVPMDPEAGSHAAIVLRYGEHQIGVLSVDWKKAGAYDGVVIRNLEELAARYAAAYKTFDVDSGFRTIDNMLNPGARHDLSDTIPQLLQTVAAMVGTHQGTILLRRPETGMYHVAAQLEDVTRDGTVDWYEPGEGVTGWIIASNRPLRIRDLADGDELRRIDPNLRWKDKIHDSRDRDNTSYLGVPISVGDEVLGVLRLACADKGFFTTNDEQMAMAAASRLAGPLYQRHEDRRRDAITRLSVGIPSVGLQAELAVKAFDTLSTGIGSCECHIRILDGMETSTGGCIQVLRRLAVSHSGWETTRDVRAMDDGISGRVWKSGARVVYHEIDEYDWVRSTIHEDLPERLRSGVGSGACVPMYAGADFIGTLHVHRKYRKALSPRDINFIEEIARLAGPALRAAGEAEERALRLRIDSATDCFLRNLLDRKPLDSEERALWSSVLASVSEGLHGSAYWLRVPDKAGTSYVAWDLEAFGTSCIHPISTLRVEEALDGKDFLVVSDPDSDVRLARLRQEAPAGLEEPLADSRAMMIRVKAGEEPIALLSVVVPPPHRINYDMTRKAAEMLHGVGDLVQLARRFEMTMGEIETSRPLVLLGALYSRIQHEIKGPIERQLGAIDALVGLDRTKDQIDFMLNEIRGGVLKLGENVKNMLCLVGLVKQPMHSFDLVEMLEAAIDHVSPGALGPRIELQSATRPLHLAGIREYLQIALEFIIKNAIDAPRDDGTPGYVLALASDQGNGWCKIVIRDNGKGMAPDVRRNALVPFFTTKNTGTGLGLSAAYCIIRCHRGRLDIDSIPDGPGVAKESVGTTITIQLPIHQEAVDVESKDPLR